MTDDKLTSPVELVNNLLTTTLAQEKNYRSYEKIVKKAINKCTKVIIPELNRWEEIYNQICYELVKYKEEDEQKSKELEKLQKESNDLGKLQKKYKELIEEAEKIKKRLQRLEKENTVTSQAWKTA